MRDRINEIDIWSNENLTASLSDMDNLVYTYIVGFGNISGANEGGIRSDTDRISLSEYMRYIFETGSYKKLVKPIQLEGLNYNSKIDSKVSFQLLSWIDTLDDIRKSSLYNETEVISGGYRPFNDIDVVKTRFGQDLCPTNKSIPIIASWGDHEYKMCGYDIGIVVQDRNTLFQVVENMPYLVSNHIDVTSQVDNFLHRMTNFSFPSLLLYETSVIPERKSKENGSRWAELSFNVQNKALNMGAKHAIGFTFLESRYFQQAMKRKDFVYHFQTDSNTGMPSQFFALDLNNSVTNLAEKIRK